MQLYEMYDNVCRRLEDEIARRENENFEDEKIEVVSDALMTLEQHYDKIRVGGYVNIVHKEFYVMLGHLIAYCSDVNVSEKLYQIRENLIAARIFM